MFSTRKLGWQHQHLCPPPTPDYKQVHSSYIKVFQRMHADSAWKVGDACLAKFPGNGKWYESVIVSVDSEGRRAVVHYEGYAEDGEHSFDTLAR